MSNMAVIRLKPNECVRGYLPLVCVRCGQLAEDSKAFRFTRLPTWMYLAFFAAGLPCVILAVRIHFVVLAAAMIWVLGVITLRKSATVDLPVCHKHRRRLGVNTAVLFILVPVIVVLIFAVVGVPYLLSSKGVIPDGVTFCALPIILFAFLGFAVMVSRGGIRPTAIADTGITIKGVHNHFADVVRELRD